MTFTEIYLTDLERFQQNVCNGCGMPTGDADSSGHLVPSLWDLHMFYLLRPILFRTCRYFTGLCSSNIPRYFLDYAYRFLSAESKDYINSASHEYRNMSARRGPHFAPIGIPNICSNTFPAKTTKMLSTRNSSILMMSSSVYMFFDSECSFKK